MILREIREELDRLNEELLSRAKAIKYYYSTEEDRGFDNEIIAFSELQEEIRKNIDLDELIFGYATNITISIRDIDEFDRMKKEVEEELENLGETYEEIVFVLELRVDFPSGFYGTWYFVYV